MNDAEADDTERRSPIMNDTNGHALPTGYRLREYRVERVLGEGGFGITYLAEDTQLGALRAIKEYLPGDLAHRSTGMTVHARSGAAVEDFAWGLQRFLDEARTLACFEGHPNIVRVSHIIEENGTAYMVMSYHEGETLDERLEREGTPDADTLWRIFDPVLDGLAEVHGADMLHRDVKPANIYLRADDTPILLDFGAARQSLSQRSRSFAAIVSEGYSRSSSIPPAATGRARGPISTHSPPPFIEPSPASGPRRRRNAPWAPP